MEEKEVLEIFAKHSAILTDDHVVYTRGKHGKAYVNKDAIYPYTEDLAILCKEIAHHFYIQNYWREGWKIDVVAAPAVGGISLIQWVAHFLSNRYGKQVLAVYAEKNSDGSFVFNRGYADIVANSNVLIVEDVINTGGSVQKVIDLVKPISKEVVGVGALCNRGGITTEELGIKELFALVNVTMDAWDEADCPMCKEGKPINIKVGKGREYLAKLAKS